MGRLTGFSKRFVIKPCLAHLERMPVLSIKPLVNIHYIKVLILFSECEKSLVLMGMSGTYHPQLMHVVSHEDRPMLRWIWRLVDLFCDHLAQPGLFGKPLSCWSSHRMPTQLNSAGLSIDFDLIPRNDVRSLAKAQFLGDLELALEQIVFSTEALVSHRLGGFPRQFGLTDG